MDEVWPALSWKAERMKYESAAAIFTVHYVTERPVLRLFHLVSKHGFKKLKNRPKASRNLRRTLSKQLKNARSRGIFPQQSFLPGPSSWKWHFSANTCRRTCCE